MTGGKHNTNDDQLDSTETYKNGEWTCGPKLPFKQSDHCQVQYRNTHIIAGKFEIKQARFIRQTCIPRICTSSKKLNVDAI